MKATDRSILIGLVILGLLACFWFLLLAPKREEASELGDKVTELQSEVAEQEDLAAAAADGQEDYARNYERLVVLGKAAPADGDTPSFLAQLSALAERSGTEFGSLTAGGEESIAPPPPAAQTTTDQNAAEGDSTAGASNAAEAEAAESPAPATEASAASLPLGASVGPAGLGVLPYSLNFEGNFFQVADLLGRFDSQVAAGESRAVVDGRLMTVNGFTMSPTGEGNALSVELSVTTYVLPESQGLTAGASPTAPPASVPAAVPTSTTPAP